MAFLSDQQLQQVTQAVEGLNPAQLAWVSGYLTGLSGQLPATSAAVTPSQTAGKVTILFGSQTGNSKKIAQQLSECLSAAGHDVVLSNMKDYRTNQLKKESTVLAVISTHGNGEPPDEALAFFKFLNSDRAPKLEKLNYAVLALGDSSYDEFCQTGKELDERFAALGATPLISRVDCDIDFEEDALDWQTTLLKELDDQPVSETFSDGFAPSTSSTEYSDSRPYQAEVLNVLNLTDEGSEKEVYHLELSLEDSGINYQPGDILAIKPENNRLLVSEVLREAGLNGDTVVTIKDDKLPLLDALLQRRELASLTRKVVQEYAKATGNIELAAQAADKSQLVDLIGSGDLLDLLQQHPGKLNAQTLVDLLRPLQARQYSIASSLEAHPEEVHLLIKRVEFQHEERTHLGVASNWVAQLNPGDFLPVYVKPNDSFKLPADDDTKIIMVGPGTGVAPFRAFLSERDAKGIDGNSWLFFGEQHFRSDFLYQTEWQQFKKHGTLERIDLAFSRDQEEKIYVQHRLLEAGAEVYQWLEDGAHVYVCGDMNHMAKDVHETLKQIHIEFGGLSEEQAETELEQLIANGRYQRDVY